jgi:ActR/RegA family two-component response regulator
MSPPSPSLPSYAAAAWKGIMNRHSLSGHPVLFLVHLFGGLAAMLGGRVMAQATTSGTAGAGIAVAFFGFLGLLLPLYYRDRSEKRAIEQERWKAEQASKQANLQGQLNQQREEMGHQKAEAAQAKQEASRAKVEAAQAKAQYEEIRTKIEGVEALASKNTTNIAAVKATAEVAHEKVTDLGMFPSTRTEGETSSRPLSLLIVEDDPAPMYKLAKWFQLRGFTVTTAASVGEAIEAISAPGRDPHWAIIDLKMAGGGSGLDILKKIKEENKPTSVIVSTGVSDDEVLEEVKNMGAHKVFVKPTEPDVLWQTIMDEQARKLASQP